MFERILLPQDGSEVSEAIVPFVRSLAKGCSSNVTVLHVANSGPGERVLVHIPTGSKMDLHGYLGKLQRQFEEDGVPTATAVLQGEPHDEIVGLADRRAFGLIAMATHGRSGVKQWAFGSTTDKVMQSTGVPLLIVRSREEPPPSAEPESFRTVVVPLDGSTLAESALPAAQWIASKLGLEIVLIQVVQPFYPAIPHPDPHLFTPGLTINSKDVATDYLNEQAARLRETGLSVAVRVEEGQTPQRILDVAEESGDAVIAMSTHGRTGLTRWLFGSVADRVVRASPRPVLLIRPSKETQVVA